MATRGRPPKKKDPDDHVPLTESQLLAKQRDLEAREAILNERDAILHEMPEGFSDVEMRNWFDRQRPVMLAGMLAIATKGESEKTRKEMLLELKNMDMGRPGAQKRDESDAIGAYIFRPGKYGIPAE